MRRCRERRVAVSPLFLCVLFLFYLMDRQNLLLPILAAAALHEVGHVAAVYCVGGRIDRFRLTAFGGELRICHPEQMSYGGELLSVLAGPGVNLACALLFAQAGKLFAWEAGYVFSGIHLLLGFFNLLPIRQLDGGRALYLLICWLAEPITAERVMHGCSCVCLCLMLLLSAAFLACAGIRLSAVLMAAWFLLCGFLETGIVKTRLSG